MIDVDTIFNQLKELQQHVKSATQKVGEYDEENDSIEKGKQKIIKEICDATNYSTKEEREKAEGVLSQVIDKLTDQDSNISDVLEQNKSMFIKAFSDPSKMQEFIIKDADGRETIAFQKQPEFVSAEKKDKFEIQTAAEQDKIKLLSAEKKDKFEIQTAAEQDKFQIAAEGVKDQVNVEKAEDTQNENQQPNNSNAGGKIIIPMDLIVAPTMAILCAMGPLGAAAALILFLKKAGKTKELDLTAFLDEFQKATNCDAEILDKIKNGIVDGAKKQIDNEQKLQVSDSTQNQKDGPKVQSSVEPQQVVNNENQQAQPSVKPQPVIEAQKQNFANSTLAQSLKVVNVTTINHLALQQQGQQQGQVHVVI